MIKGIDKNEKYLSFNYKNSFDLFINLCKSNREILISFDFFQSKINELIKNSLIYSNIVGFYNKYESYLEDNTTTISLHKENGETVLFLLVGNTNTYENEELKLTIIKDFYLGLPRYKLSDKYGNYSIYRTEDLYATRISLFRVVLPSSQILLVHPNNNYTDYKVIGGDINNPIYKNVLYVTKTISNSIEETTYEIKKDDSLVINKVKVTKNGDATRIQSGIVENYYNLDVTISKSFNVQEQIETLLIYDNIRTQGISIEIDIAAVDSYENMSILNEHNQQTTISYKIDGKSTKVTDNYGNETTYYFKNDRCYEIIDSSTTSYIYENSNKLIEIEGTAINRLSYNNIIGGKKLYINNVYTQGQTNLDYPNDGYQTAKCVLLTSSTNSVKASFSYGGLSNDVICSIIKLKLNNNSNLTNLRISINFYDEANNELLSFNGSKDFNVELGRWNTILFANSCLLDYHHFEVSLTFIDSSVEGMLYIDTTKEPIVNTHEYDDNNNVIKQIVSKPITNCYYDNNAIYGSNSSYYQYLIQNSQRTTIISKEVDLFNVTKEYQYSNNLPLKIQNESLSYEDFQLSKFYSYDTKNYLVATIFNDQEIIYNYDNMDRLSRESLINFGESSITISKSYEYNLSNVNNPELLSKISFSISSDLSNNHSNNLSYQNGFISNYSYLTSNSSYTQQFEYLYNNDKLLYKVRLKALIYYGFQNFDLIEYAYNNYKDLSAIIYPTGQYNFYYDNKRRINSIKYGNTDLFSFTYSSYFYYRLINVEYSQASIIKHYNYLDNGLINDISYVSNNNQILKILYNSNEKTLTNRQVIEKSNGNKIVSEVNPSNQLINTIELFNYLCGLKNTFVTFMDRPDDGFYKLVNSYLQTSENDGTIVGEPSRNIVDHIHCLGCTILSYSFPNYSPYYSFHIHFMYESTDSNLIILRSLNNNVFCKLKIENNQIKIINCEIDSTNPCETINYPTLSDGKFHSISFLNRGYSFKIFLDGNERYSYSFIYQKQLNFVQLDCFQKISMILFNYLNSDDITNLKYQENLHNFLYQTYLNYSKSLLSLDNNNDFSPYRTVSNNSFLSAYSDIITFHNSFNSINGKEPINKVFGHNHGLFNNYFVFDETINQNVYYHMRGDSLSYTFESNGSITLLLNFKILSKEGLFSFKVGNIFFYFSSNLLVCSYNNQLYSLNYHLSLNIWFNVAISFNTLYGSNSLEDNNYEFNIYVDGILKQSFIETSDLRFNGIVRIDINDGSNYYMENLFVDNRELSSTQINEIINNFNVSRKMIKYFNSLNLITSNSLVSNSQTVYKEQYGYMTINNNKFPLANSITYSYRDTNNSQINKTFSYQYDYLYNLKIVKKNGVTINAYNYDSLNRVTSEMNWQVPGPLYVGYSYNSLGNIISIEDPDGTYSFTYDSFGRLTNALNYSFQYNGSCILLPSSMTKSNVTYSISYIGKTISSFTSSTKTISYKYNENNQRINKTIIDNVNNTTISTDYFYDANDNLIYEQNNNYSMTYLYENGSIYGFIYLDNEYYYVKDVLGKINGIIDKNGKLIVKYYYSAWGKIYNIVDYSQINLGQINPIRFYSYYYDNELDLYYLTTRYYCPTICRFITPDSIKYLNPQSINGLNLYCYCVNNPINKYDPTGHFAISLTVLGLIIGAAIGATAGGIIAYNIAQSNGAEGWELFGWTMAGIVGGGIVGGALGAGVGAIVTKTTGVIGLSITKYSIIPIKGTTVLGHTPGYIEVARATGSGYYLVSNWTYDKMLQNGVEWTNNMTYLKDANSLGSRFALAPDFVVREGGTFWKEIQYLIENGILWEMF